MECPLSRVAKAEHSLFHSNVLAAFTPWFAEKYRMVRLRETYERLWDAAYTELHKPRRFRETEEIVGLKEKRKDYFLLLKRSIQNSQKSPEEEKRDAAEVLSFVIWDDRNAHRESYLNSTGMITKLIEKLREEENFVHVQTLGLTTTLDALEKTNERFNEVNIERSTEAKRRAEEVKTKKIRPQLDAAYRQIIKALEALYTANELTAQDATVREEVGQLIKSIAALAMRLKKTLHIRQARAAGKAEREETEEMS